MFAYQYRRLSSLQWLLNLRRALYVAFVPQAASAKTGTPGASPMPSLRHAGAGRLVALTAQNTKLVCAEHSRLGRHIVLALLTSVGLAGAASAQSITTTVVTGSSPVAVAINPVTNKIYVANQGSVNVTVIDGATNSTTTVAAGSNPRAVAINPVTNKIYVANESSNDVTVIDGAPSTFTQHRTSVTMAGVTSRAAPIPRLRCP